MTLKSLFQIGRSALLYRYENYRNFRQIKKNPAQLCRDSDDHRSAVTRIRTWVVAATTRSTNHYTITAITAELLYVIVV